MDSPTAGEGASCQVAGGGGGRPPGPLNATTRSAAGTRRRPSATVGVEKWLASVPIVFVTTAFPVAGASPFSTPLRPSDQMRPLAITAGQFDPVEVCQSSFMLGGEAVTVTASSPCPHGT